MTANKESVYWKTNKDWWFINESGDYELTNEAPERAVKSFEIFKSKNNA